MSQNRSASPPPQDPDPVANQRSANFVEWLFGDLKERTFLAGSVPGDRKVTPEGYYSDTKMMAMPANQRHHVSSGVYPLGLPPKHPGGKLPSRDESKIEWVPCIVFDDVGIAAAPGAVSLHGVEVDESEFAVLKPSWTMLTSTGRSQYGYAFAPMPDLEVARILHDQLKARPQFGGSVLHSIGQYCRTPSGHNTKPGRGDFPTRLTSIGETYTVEEFAEAFGLSLEAVPRARPTAVGETCDIETLRAILDLLPNDDWFEKRDEHRWGKVGMSIFGATEGSPDGRDLWMEWCATWFSMKTGKKVMQDGDPALDANYWDTLVPGNVKSSVSTLRRIVQDRYGSLSKEYRRAGELTSQPKAQAAFEPIPDAEPMPETAAKAEDEITRLLKEISRYQPIPAKHREDDDPTILDDVFQRVQKTLVDPPVLITPYPRGKLATLAGPPSVGKSLLLQQQCMTIAMERADLLRYGTEKIRFAGDIVYFCNEDGKRVFDHRAKAWLQHHKVDPTQAKHRLHPVVSPLLTRRKEGLAYDCLGVLKAILQQLKAGRAIAMIVVDTMPASVLGFEENSASDMAYVTDFLKRLASSFWAAVVFIHHTIKAAWNGGGDNRSLAAIRGSGSMPGAIRAGVYALWPTDEEAALLPPDSIVEWVAKAADGRQGYAVCYWQKVLETIDVEDAEVDGRMTTREVPVLIPVVIQTAAFDDEDELDRLKVVIDNALAAGEEVRAYGSNTRTGNATAIHIRWGMGAKEAHDIFTKMKARGWFRSRVIDDKHNKTSYEKVLR